MFDFCSMKSNNSTSSSKVVVLLRCKYSLKQILGNLFVIEGTKILFQCKTLELAYRGNKKNISAVIAGIFPLVLEWSPKFKKMLWELKDVPGRSEAKFHVANFVHQLNGCIALGYHYKDIDGDGRVDIMSSSKALSGFHGALFGETKSTLYIFDTQH